jgi:DNA-binding Xre family transcriptional regulator
MLIDKGLKKKDFAKIVGLNNNTVAKLGRGQGVSMNVLYRICKTFNCDVADIVEIARENSDD